ncbi:hypothetical protein ACPXB3_15900 [Gordonia sp. DT219]
MTYQQPPAFGYGQPAGGSFYVNVLGQEYGPLGIAELQQMALAAS